MKFRNGKFTQQPDELAPETPLQIQLLGTSDHAPKSVAITMRTPGRDADLALGFLFSEGILQHADQVLSVEHRDADTESGQNTLIIKTAPGTSVDWARLERHGYTSSSCGVCGKTSLEQVHAALPFPEPLARWKTSPEVIIDGPEKLRTAQQNFARTGGIHGVGLLNLAGELVHHAEDVGRHNAMDKVIGHAFREGWLPLNEHLIVLSGRASFELIQKAAMAGVQFVLSVGAPSTLAVSLAEDQGMTLCGFVRGGGFNCYCGVGRVEIT
ncbi:formate dehydrogenase accessory sulfurtransferase FdhD [Neolewinella antarctica]|uniref:Sulfur carrier protein FdhD n=1 Tax=Neolewinella antarctica TaxID=442734 RepID=A0ABX0XFC1_9BACT|nr:formate dehydrogenase accessory sulfurtransferase FdhD [Neolewinella antarctica]NJC27931.1 FdhD protein [Neolewinella antarctica]